MATVVHQIRAAQDGETLALREIPCEVVAAEIARMMERQRPDAQYVVVKLTIQAMMPVEIPDMEDSK